MHRIRLRCRYRALMSKARRPPMDTGVRRRPRSVASEARCTATPARRIGVGRLGVAARLGAHPFENGAAAFEGQDVDESDGWHQAEQPLGRVDDIGALSGTSIS